jgi:hypothetical protein
LDRFCRLEAVRELLAVPGRDEEGIVDANAEGLFGLP